MKTNLSITKNGELTRYGLACGLVEHSEDFSMYMDNGVIMIRGHVRKMFVKFSFTSLTMARKKFKELDLQSRYRMFTLADLTKPDSEFPHIYVDEPDFVIKRTWWQDRGLMQTSSGYGKKLMTDKMIYFEGRLRRVYCTLFSNSGSCWIVYKGKMIFVN